MLSDPLLPGDRWNRYHLPHGGYRKGKCSLNASSRYDRKPPSADALTFTNVSIDCSSCVLKYPGTDCGCASPKLPPNQLRIITLCASCGSAATVRAYAAKL